jgi:hypothetical protein
MDKHPNSMYTYLEDDQQTVILNQKRIQKELKQNLCLDVAIYIEPQVADITIKGVKLPVDWSKAVDIIESMPSSMASMNWNPVEMKQTSFKLSTPLLESIFILRMVMPQPVLFWRFATMQGWAFLSKLFQSFLRRVPMS